MNKAARSSSAHASEAQIEAFEDTWHWTDQAEAELSSLAGQPNTDVTQMMHALVSFLGRNDMTAYLVMMATRLLALHRVLKPTGSLYLHCDPTASHSPSQQFGFYSQSSHFAFWSLGFSKKSLVAGLLSDVLQVKLKA